MNDITETITEVLRLDEEATPGPWEPFAGSVVREGETAYLVHGGPDTDAALVAYYRTAAPALAREVQRLQGEVRIDADALVEMMEESRRVGQEAMRERCAVRVDRAALDDLADAIRALEVQHDDQ